jgi:putative transposase
MSQSYPSDLTDEQWELLSELIPSAKPGGRPRQVDMQAVVNAILYILCTGCAWRMLPHDFPAGRRCITTFGNGVWMELGLASAKSYSSGCE